MTASAKDRFWSAARKLVAFVAAISGLCLALGFAGVSHPALDTLALGRPLFCVLTLCTLFALSETWARLTLGILCGLGLASVIVTFLPGPERNGDLRVYSKNVYHSNPKLDLLAADIMEANPDVIFLQEITERTQPLLDLITPGYPHQHLCRNSGALGVAVLSKTPFVAPSTCSQSRALALSTITHQGRQIWVASVHIHWMWPANGPQAHAIVSDTLRKLDGPIVIGGDFNAFAWTHRVKDIQAVSDTRIAGPVLPSLSIAGFVLPIDMVLAPGGGTSQLRAALGSDHRGILADVSLSQN